MPKARLVFDGDNIYTEKDARIYKLKNDISSKIDGIPGVVNSLDSISTTDALSANMGRQLQDQINSLSGTGKFLSTWDCTTGLPGTNPQEDPYTYKVGDYYVVSATGSTNYKPHGGTYTQGVPSITVELENVGINDKYYFDGADWVRIPDTSIQISIDSTLSTTSTNAVENRAIATAINGKQDIISDLSTIRNGAAAGATALQPNDNISQLTNNIGYQTAGDVASAMTGKQDILTAGDGISLTNNIVTNTKPGAAVSNIAPSNPTEGMSRYDTVNHVLKIYNGTAWETVDTDTTYTAGEGIEILDIQDYSAMQGPAPTGFHVPMKSEWEGLITIMNGLSLTTGNSWRINLHMPFAGFRTPNILYQGSEGYYWSSSPQGPYGPIYARDINLDSSNVTANISSPRDGGLSLRCFKNSYATPGSSWTVVQGTLGSAGIFWNQSEGLISITDGSTGYTIMDKNLGATTVYNDGDILTQANMGNMYQWGNNYGFPSTGTISNTSPTQVDATGYGPGNYYSSDTFIASGADWSSVQNDNLWGGVTGVVTLDNAITNTGVLSVNGQTGHIKVNDAKASTIAPSGPAEGDLWYDTANHVLKIYNGTIWKTVDTDSDTTYTAGNGINISAQNEISADTSVVATQSDITNITNTVSGLVSDIAFSSSWDGDTTHTPSKNAIYDVLGDVEVLLANI